MSHRTVAESWREIETWLSEHAPKILQNLNPGADDAQLRYAEKSLGVPMPEGWREFYRIHNGMNEDGNLGNLLFGMTLYELDHIVAHHQEKAQSGAEVQPVEVANAGICKRNMHNSNWIVFAHDRGDVLLAVDLEPAVEGSAGQIICIDYADDVAILLAPSIEELMEDFVADLHAGEYSLNEEALEDGEHFLACSQEIDVVNWAHSPRWRNLKEERYPGMS